jgi:hypothetical protein
VAVYLFHGDKGGVGKSTAAATFTEYLLAHSIMPVIVDTDLRNNELASMFEKTDVPTYIVGLRDTAGWRDLINLLGDRRETDVVIALPGNIGSEVDDQSALFFEALQGLHRSLSLFWLLNRSPQSVALLGSLPDTITQKARALVAVRNLYFGEGDRFTRWLQSNVRKRFIAAGGLEIDLPDLMDLVVDATILANPIRRFTDTDALTYADRLITKHWLDQVFASFDSVAAKVGVGER